MTTIEERREIAARLRALPDLATMGELAECVFGRKCSWSAGGLADTIADLVEPSCDRDALLELTDELEGEGLDGWASGPLDVGEYARRIREACGHRIVGKGEPTWL